jgi:serine/threonine protein kinase
MAPEQATGQAVHPLSDMFAAGVVFYEFLTLQKPFVGRTLHSVLYQIISEHPLPVLTLNPDVPARLASIVHRMLEKEPERRFDSMGEVATRVRAIHAAYRRSRSRSALPQGAGTEPAEASSEEHRRRLRDHLTRGQDHLGAGRIDQAIAEMDEALVLDPQCVEAVELIWRARHASGETATGAR